MRQNLVEGPSGAGQGERRGGFREARHLGPGGNGERRSRRPGDAAKPMTAVERGDQLHQRADRPHVAAIDHRVGAILVRIDIA